MLNLYQLQMFVIVAERASFSLAAKELLVTQPAVSEQIRGLEQRLGVQLFNRRGRKLELTPEGAAMLEPARRLLALAAETEQLLLAQRDTLGGRLRLGCSTSAAAPTLAALAGEFYRLHPQVSLKIEPQERSVLLDMLRDGQIDAGFTGEKVRGRGLEHQLVATDEWLLLAPADHEWCRPGDAAGDSSPDPPFVRFAQLREQPLVVETVESKLGLQTRRELQDLLDERGLAWRELRLALELPDAQAVSSAVLRGAGVGLLPRSALVSTSGMRLFALQGQPLLRRLYMVRSRRNVPSRVARAWWEFVSTHALSARPSGADEATGE